MAQANSRQNLEDKIDSLRQIIDDKDFKADWNPKERRELFDELLSLQIEYKRQYKKFYKPKDLNSR